MNFEKTNKIENEIVNLPVKELEERIDNSNNCLLYTSPSPRDS